MSLESDKRSKVDEIIEKINGVHGPGYLDAVDTEVHLRLVAILDGDYHEAMVSNNESCQTFEALVRVANNYFEKGDYEKYLEICERSDVLRDSDNVVVLYKKAYSIYELSKNNLEYSQEDAEVLLGKVLFEYKNNGDGDEYIIENGLDISELLFADIETQFHHIKQMIES